MNSLDMDSFEHLNKRMKLDKNDENSTQNSNQTLASKIMLALQNKQQNTSYSSSSSSPIKLERSIDESIFNVLIGSDSPTVNALAREKQLQLEKQILIDKILANKNSPKNCTPNGRNSQKRSKKSLSPIQSQAQAAAAHAAQQASLMNFLKTSIAGSSSPFQNSQNSSPDPLNTKLGTSQYGFNFLNGGLGQLPNLEKLPYDDNDNLAPTLLNNDLNNFSFQADGNGPKSGFNTEASIKLGTIDPLTFENDNFDQYIVRYDGSRMCGDPGCMYQHKDHYHCSDPPCNFAKFTNKHDVVRHYNMHKKRDNALSHGFMRFAPAENCTDFPTSTKSCKFNGKSTHYHCMHCEKYYTSTSDVVTHENYHKKSNAFINDGFRRYKAADVCGDLKCQYRDQKTTHFHCTRGSCDFVFKNKSDIDKHKQYHVKDEAYMQQGFKKFYRSEDCNAEKNCPWRLKSNHFHCLKCHFSFTSTSQMLSHRRKHDKQITVHGAILENVNPEKAPNALAVSQINSQLSQLASQQKLNEENNKLDESVFLSKATPAHSCKLTETCFVRHLSHFHCQWENCAAIFPESLPELINNHKEMHNKIEGDKADSGGIVGSNDTTRTTNSSPSSGQLPESPDTEIQLSENQSFNQAFDLLNSLIQAKNGITNNNSMKIESDED